MSRAIDHLPVIDLSPLVAGRPRAIEQVGAALRQAVEEVGFFAIEGHGVPQHVVDDAFDVSRRFFEESDAEKRAVAVNDAHRGYIGFNTQTNRSSSEGATKSANLSESLMLMHDVEHDDPRFGEFLQGANQWPAVDGFRLAIERYRGELERVARLLVDVCFAAIGLDVSLLGDAFDRPTTFLRLLHYPADDAPAGERFGSAPHTDYGCITVLAQGEVAGLEVRMGDEWVLVPPRRGSFVVNLGDLMPVWSAGRLVSTPHRVANRSGLDRYSIAYFFDPDLRSVIEPLMPPVDGAVVPAPFTFESHVHRRLSNNFDYRRPTPS